MLQRLLFFIFYVFFTNSICFAQNFLFNQLTIYNGLLSNNIRTVWQDKNGYLWIGLNNGLQRFDGYRFTTVLTTRTDQIINDKDGNVWIRSGKEIGLFNIQTFKFTAVKYEQSETISNYNKIWLRQTQDGSVFVVLVGKNVQFYAHKNQSFSTKNNPLTIADSIKVVDLVDDKTHNRFWIIGSNSFGYWDKAKHQYITTSNNTQQDNIIAYHAHSSLNNTKFFIDEKNNYLLYQPNKFNGKFKYFLRNRTSSKAPLAQPQLDINSKYFEIYNGKKLSNEAFAVYGLNYLNIRWGNQFYNFSSPHFSLQGIQFNSVQDVYQDKEGFIWVATDNGLYYTSAKLRNNEHVSIEQGTERRTISSFLQTTDNAIWINTWGGGVFEWKDNKLEQNIALQNVYKKDSATKLAWSICEIKKNNLLIGCNDGKLVQFDKAINKATVYHLPIFENSAIWQLVKDKDNCIWAGLQNGKIFKLKDNDGVINNNNFQQIFSLGGPIYKMAIVNTNFLWVAVTGKGLYVIDLRSEKIIKEIDANNSRNALLANIRDVFQFNDSTVLLGGERLGKVNTKTYEVNYNFPFSTGILGAIFTIQKDKKNNCWLGTASGIYKLNLQSGKLNHYNQENGLITVHNNSYVPERSYALPNGRLIFGGNQHFVMFNPEDFNNQPQPPDVTITGFKINNHYLAQDSVNKLKQIELPYNQGLLSLEFAAISFLQKGQLTYEYKLEGLNNHWIELTNPETINYNFLPNGHYKFLVRAKNETGIYSKNITSVPIFIRPPFWKTAWFYLVVVLLLGGVLYFLYRQKIKRILQIERLRSKLARDLHDDMGSTLSTINILSNVLLKQPSNNESLNKEYMGKISKSTTQMMEAMDDIVWSINPANDDMARVVARMKETAGVLLDPLQINYEFNIDASVNNIKISVDKKRDLFLIFKEALNNAIKYAECSKIIVSFKENKKILEMMVWDDGKGMELTNSKSIFRGNGLGNMKNRAENMNATLSVNSEKGKGVQIMLRMPIA